MVERAIDRRSEAVWRRRPFANNTIVTLVVCFSTFVGIGFAAATLGPSLPEVAAVVGLPLASAGVIRAFRQIGNLAVQVPGGYLIDRLGGRMVLLCGALGVGVGLVGMLITPTLAGLLVFSAVMGLGTGLLELGPNVVVGMVLSGSALSSALAGLHAFYGIGASTGPGILAALGWQRTYLVGAVLCVLVMAGVGVMRLPKRDRVVQAGGGRMNWQRLVPLGVFVLIYNGVEFAVGDWLYVQLRLGMRAPESVAVQGATVFWMMLTAGRLVSVWGLRRFGRRAVLGGALVVSLVGMACVSVSSVPVIVGLIGAGLAGFGFAPVHPISVSFASDSQPGAEGRAIGVLGALAAAGSIVGPVLHGWVGGGHDGGMVVSLTAVLAMIVIAVFWMKVWRSDVWNAN